VARRVVVDEDDEVELKPRHAAAPAPSSVNGGFGLVTVILLALVAGVAAFFLSKLIPI
jgi:hypothetical protein